MAYFHGPDDPVYTIGVAARLLGETPQFLRQIENEGLILPARTESNIRLYSNNDLRLLARVIYLWRRCVINPQGIRVIITMEEGDSDSQAHGKNRARGPTNSEKGGSQNRGHNAGSSTNSDGLVKGTR